MATATAARRITLVLVLGAVSLAAAPAPARKRQADPPPPAETGLIDNVNGLAVGKDGQVEHFTGLLIGKDGRVEQRLAPNDKRPERPAFRLDGEGRTLIPSFIDGHARLMTTGIAQLTLDLSDTQSLADAQAKIAAYAGANQGRKWILGRGWDPARWAEASGSPESLPTAEDIDRIATAVPVWLISADGEMGWANSLAMKQAGIGAASKAPPAGKIILANGKPSGVFLGTAMNLIAHIVPLPAPKDRDIALDKAQPLFLAAGIGALADMGTTIDDWQAYRRAGDRGALRLRIAGYADGIDNMVTIAGPAPSPWLYDNRLRLTGVYFAIDGSPGARTAWLKEPYADASDEKGAPKIGSTILRNQMSRAAMDGFQVALSAHGDAALEEAISAIGELAATYEGDRRWRIEGAEVAGSLASVGSAIFNGIVFTARPAMAVFEQSARLRRLGPDRAAPLWQIPGVRLSFGDWAAGTVPSPFVAIAAAMDGFPLQGSAQNRLSFDQAFAAATRNAAVAIRAEDRIGALEPGQWADFLLIDRDISAASPDDIANTKLLEHWMAGKRVWKASGAQANTALATTPSPSLK